MPPKKVEFPPQKDNLHRFFKPIPRKQETKDATISVSEKPFTSITKNKNELPAPRPATEAQSLSSDSRMTSSQRIIKDSDEEESDLSEPSDSDQDLPKRPPSHAAPTTITSGKNGQPSPQFGLSEAKPSSSEPRMTSQLTVEDSDEESDTSVAPYLKQTPKSKTKDAGSSLSDTPPITTTNKKSGRLPPKPVNAQSASARTTTTTGKQAFEDPFNEEDSSDSDSDLPDLFMPPTTTEKSTSRSTRKPRVPPYGSPLTFQPKHKYKFSITSLVSQSQRHEATEASAQRAKTILNEPENREKTEKHGDNEALLESVIAHKDADSADKILQAVARTEATATDKRWYFFDPDSETPNNKPTKPPANIPKMYMKYNLGRSIDRDSTAVSGAMGHMAAFQALSEESFLWILVMACIQPTAVPEVPFFDALLADPEAIQRYLRPKAVKEMFDLLGALPGATDRKTKVEAVNVYRTAYEGRDWSTLQLYIKFLGDAANLATPLTCGYTMSLLARLCADSLVKDTGMLLSTVYDTMEALSEAIDNGYWETICRHICSDIYKTVVQESLCLQILDCIPCSTPRLRDLRRRISLAVFCQDGDLTQKPAEQTIELRKLVQVLSSPRFQISRDTDYAQLSSLICLLGIAIGNEPAADIDLSDPQVEEEYNSDIDELEYQLKIIWSSINDRGTLSPSRIHTKRTIEKLRNRLLELTRTRLKPKQSIFDLPRQGGDREGAVKQSAFMTKHFRKPIANE
ncbi:hypothetical protein V494_05280 [Pseudogymnoascus sp. VKM F-4513 (FW-928)]|nr:hypothetical protein V494_05280 [Pseudogymnoascus sp. VKM F-4513 (FW-928)]